MKNNPSIYLVKDPAENFKIDKADATHIPAILEIEKASFKGPWSEGLFLSELKNRVSNFYVVKDKLDGYRVVGYTIFWIVYGEAQILNIAVSPDMRGRGIGRLLLDFAIDKMKERNAFHIFLEVRESNNRAKDMYESSGFTEIAKRKHYYGDEDAIVMKMDL